MMGEDFFEEDVVWVAFPTWENDKRRALESRHVFFINGEINGNLIGCILRGIYRIIHCGSPNLPIILYINSEGGDLWGGWALFDALELAKAHGFKVITVAIGKVQSAATIPFLAGEPKLTTPNAIFTIHEASSWLSGKTSEQKDYLNFLSQCEKRYIELVTSRSKITPRMIRAKAYRKDWNFTASEAVKLGFADAYVTTLPTNAVVEGDEDADICLQVQK